jgi:hypothetical protein
MSGTLIQASFVYRSGTSPDLYQFTITQNAAGEIVLQDIQDPYGLIISPYTQIPQSVADDIATAILQVENIMALTSAVNGTVTFSSETEKVVTFATALASATYRVVLSPAIFATFRITSKTTAGFTIEAGASISGDVGYDVIL